MTNTAFLARQPILDLTGGITAYELLFRGCGQASGALIEDPTRATVTVLSHAFNEMGSQRVLGGKKAFVNLGLELLQTEFVELLPADRVVIEILEDVEPSPELVRRVAELRRRGYSFALDDYVHHRRYAPLLGHVDYVKVDVLATERAAVERWCRALAPRRLTLLAEKVETQEQHAWAHDQGFQLFQGYYFARPQTLQCGILHSSSARVAQLMSLVRRDCDPAAIEAVFKRDPALTLKLLTYANSVRFGPAETIGSIRLAVVVLWQRQLYRWLALLLLQVNGQAPPALAATAVARGRMCELIADGRVDQDTRDDLFLAGVLSLLPALLNCDLEAFLDSLDLAEPVLEALRSREGPLGPFLELAESVEGGDPERVEACAEQIGVTADRVNEAHLDAVFWSLDETT